MLSVIYRVGSLGLFGYCAHATISNILSAGKVYFFKTENEKMVQYYQNEIRTKYFVYKYTRLGGIVEWWLAPLCHSNKAFLCAVCMFSLCLCGFYLSTLASSHNPKICMGLHRMAIM